MQRATTGPNQVQLVQQNVQLNVHPTPSDHAQVIEDRANLQIAAAQLQHQRASLEAAVQQHTAALQQRADELARMESVTQQELVTRVHHIESTLAAEARTFAQNWEQQIQKEKHNVYLRAGQLAALRVEYAEQVREHEVWQYRAHEQAHEREEYEQAWISTECEAQHLATFVVGQEIRQEEMQQMFNDAEVCHQRLLAYYEADANKQLGQKEQIFNEAIQANQQLHNERQDLSTRLFHEEGQVQALKAQVGTQVASARVRDQANAILR
jgi:hypothetical protein